MQPSSQLYKGRKWQGHFSALITLCSSFPFLTGVSIVKMSCHTAFHPEVDTLEEAELSK